MPDNQQKYLIRDPQGNVYGPADMEMLRQWVEQGRIVPGMSIALPETREWMEVSAHPGLADLFGRTQIAGSPEAGSAQAYSSPVAPSPMAQSTQMTVSPGQPERLASIPYEQNMIAYAPPAAQNVLGLLSFIFGAAGMVLSVCICIWFVSCMFDLTAITLGAIALYQIKENPSRYTSRGFAITGLVMGSVMLMIYLIGFVVFFANITFHP